VKNHRGPEERKRRPSRLLRQERRRWDDDTQSPLALGCPPCPELGKCGGKHTKQHGLSCLEECCGNPSGCEAVCPNNPEQFVARVREINGFELGNIPRADKLVTADLPVYAPHLYHGYRREAPLQTDAVAIPLHALYGRRNGALRFPDRDAVAKKFKLHPDTKIILVGSGFDPAIEAWWKLSDGRRSLIGLLASHGYELVTSPNYSLFTNQLRYDDMHSMKRIGIVQQEFAAGGIPCALHVNARTPKDYERWAQYLRERDEITHISAEFATGLKWPLRRAFHLHHMKWLSEYVGRPLHLTMIGGTEALPTLAPAFSQVTFVDAVPFVKAVNRQQVTEGNDLKLQHHSAKTERDAPIDELLANNIGVARNRIGRVVSEACAEHAAGRTAPMPKIPEKKASAPDAQSSIRDADPKSSTHDRLTETEGRR